MKVAVTVWEDSVSTVCDFCSRLLVFDVMGDKVEHRSFIPFETRMLPERVNQLEELGVKVLLCGAISRPLERMIRASGVQVIPCLRGSIEEVIRAYLDGSLSDARFILPGFGPEVTRVRRRKRWRRGGVCGLTDNIKREDEKQLG
jgi:predicted Fe-Mo cluster-binding NifX family protein